VVVDQTGPHPQNLVGTDGCADSATADGHATSYFARRDGMSKRYNEVRIIVPGNAGVGAEVEHLMSGGDKLRNQLLF
jgi:hypothetical protein